MNQSRPFLQSVIKARQGWQEHPELLRDRLSRAEILALQAHFPVIDREIAKDRTLLYFPFAQQEAFHRNATGLKWLVAMCGNAAGKTKPLAVEAIWACMGKHPYIEVPKPPVLVWFVSINNPFLRDVAKREIDRYLPDGTSFDGAENYYTFANGSTLVLKSQQSGWEAFQGAEVRTVCWDEEGKDQEESERIFRECDQRTARVNGRILMGFTPLKGFRWIRKMIREAQDGGRKIELHSWRMEDNPYIPREEIARMKETYAEDEMRVRLYGEMIPLGVNAVFSEGRKVLLRWREEAQKAAFYHANFVERDGKVSLEPANESTSWRVYRNPVVGYEYMVIADPGGGEGEESNPSSALVVCRNVPGVVAAFRSRYHTVRQFAQECAKAGRIYRNDTIHRSALLCPEMNYNGQSFLDVVDDLRYDNLYFGRFGKAITGGARAGFHASVATKPMIEQAAHDFIRADAIRVEDVRVIDELLGYVRNPATGKSGAMSGETDDLAICFMLACFVHQDAPMQSPNWKGDEDAPVKVNQGAVIWAEMRSNNAWQKENVW